MSFTALALHPTLLKGLKELGFARPTPIQNDAIPPALEGRDLLACAMTGSGKTAAFLLPILQRLHGGTSHGKLRALILSPTRELALQIDEQALALGYHVGITAVAVVGGGHGHDGMAPLEYPGVHDPADRLPSGLLDGAPEIGGLRVAVLVAMYLRMPANEQYHPRYCSSIRTTAAPFS